MAQYRNNEDQTKKILKENKYMVLATSDKNSTPWANPVFYSNDEEYNFYFLSAIDSRHAENIIVNPKISAAIFDSTQKIGSSEGIQIEGSVSIVKRTELEKVIKLYSDKLFPTSKLSGPERYNPSDYDEPSEFRFFKITPKKVYITGVDRRAEVSLVNKEGFTP